MNELIYPYKREYIVANKKKLKKCLLESKTQFLDVKIAILAGSTANEIAEIINIFLLNYNIRAKFYISEYNKFYEDAVFDNDRLKEFNPDIVYIFTTFRNIKFELDMNTKIDDINSKLDEDYNKYVTIWENLQEKYNAIVIQNNFEYPNYRLLGNKDIFDEHGLSNYLMRLNQKLYHFARQNKKFYICDINYISACFGLDKWHNEKLYALYKYPFDIFAMVDVAYNVANIIKSIYGKNKKVLALDLDNTLWGGIISEDGYEKLKIGPDTPEGEIYFNFQKYIKKLKSIGVILNVVSKNDIDVAEDGISKTDGVLKKDDFLYIKANWESKDKNIVDIANNMNIGVESFAFVDDSEVERDIVSSNLNNVGVAKYDLPEDYIRILDKSAYFEQTNYTEEDSNKLKQYRDNVIRENYKKQFENYEDYLLSLDMRAEIKSFDKKYFDRISQLSNKSNQFNLTTKRYTVEDIEKISNDKTYITLYGRLIDKFGDNGIVALVIGKIINNYVNVELFLMSCRVLKRQMEYAMIDSLVAECKKRNIEYITGKYVKTEKNKIVKDLYNDFGFEKKEEYLNGDSLWQLNNLSKYKNKCNVFVEIDNSDYKEN